MFKLINLFVFVFFIFPASAQSSLHWEKYRASYVSISAEEDVYSPKGFSLSTTRLFNKNVFGSADFTFVNDSAVIDKVETENDTTYFDLAIGIKHSLNDYTDVYSAAAVESYQNDFIALANNQSKSDVGYSLTLGIRSVIYDKFEAHVNISRLTYASQSRWENLIGLAYHINSNLSLEFTFVKSKFANKLMLGASVGF